MSWCFRGHPDDLCKAEFAKPNNYFGFVYVIRFSTGNVKIGCTGCPPYRIANIRYIIETYGGVTVEEVAVQDPCTNFQDIETALHRRFKQSCIRGELFATTIDAVGQVLPEFPLLDETERLQRESEHSLRVLKALVLDRRICDFSDDVIDRYKGIAKADQVRTQFIVSAIAQTMDLSFEDLCDLNEKISVITSEQTLSLLGPNSGYAIWEAPDGYRFIDGIHDVSITEDEELGKVIRVMRVYNPTNPSIPPVACPSMEEAARLLNLRQTIRQDRGFDID